MSSNARLVLALILAVLVTVLLGGVLSIPWLLAVPAGFVSLILGYNVIRPNPRRLASREAAKLLSGYPQYKEMLDEAREDLDYLEEARRREKEPEVRHEIARLQETGEKITDYLGRHPEKISRARRFFTYYLETAVSVLKQLTELRQTGLDREEIVEGQRKAVQTLPRLNQAFEAQYSKLIDGDLISLEVEAKLLETAMRMDGFKVDPLSIEAGEATPEQAAIEAGEPEDEHEGTTPT